MTAEDTQAPSQHNARHRLVGALVLLALAVIFIPLILDFRRDYDQGIHESNIPPRPEDFKVQVMPLPVPGEAGAPVAPEPPPPLEHSPPASSAAGTKAPVRAQAAPAPPVRSQPGPVEPVSRPPPPDKPAQGAKGAAAMKGWVVQVGSFSSSRNAAVLRDRLTKQGLPASVEPVRIAGKPAYRVLVGPERDRAGAEARRDALRRLGLKGIVMAYEVRKP